MFNRYTENKSYNIKNYPDKINIIEKRAVTDESIKILNEMKEKTLNNITSHIKVENNILNFDFITLYEDLPLDQTTLLIKFKLNHKEIKISKTFNYSDNKYESFKRTINDLAYNRKYFDTSQLIKEEITKFLSEIIASELSEKFGEIIGKQCLKI